MRNIFAQILVAFAFFIPPVFAQDDPVTTFLPPNVLEKLPDYEQRMALSRRIHAIRPIGDFVEDTLEALAQELPEDERVLFKNTVMAGMDMDRLEYLSELHMARLFTPEELNVMVDFYAAPESESVIAKMPAYQQAFYPEVIHMINQSLATRTSSAEQAPSASPPVR